MPHISLETAMIQVGFGFWRQGRRSTTSRRTSGTWLRKKYLQESDLSDELMQSSRDVQEGGRSSLYARLRSVGRLHESL